MKTRTSPPSGGSSRSEFEAIDAIRRLRQPASTFLALGIGDDCCVLQPEAGSRLLATCDQLVEGVHFERGWMHPGFLGRKALRTSLSDVAAMGGRARACLLTVALPKGLQGRFLDDLVEGLVGDARTFEVPLAGGDLSRAERITVSATVIGSLNGPPMLRSGGRADDVIGVVGQLGWARLGLDVLRGGHWREPPASEDEVRDGASSEDAARAVLAQLLPPVHLDSGRRLAAAGVAAAIDVSDGLGQDLGHLMRASGVGAEVSAPALRALAPPGDRRRGLELALEGGEDYAVLFTVAAEAASQLRLPEDLAWTAIGRLTKESGILRLQHEEGSDRYSAQGHDHFA